MIKVYSGIKGLVIVLFLVASLVLMFSIVFWGIAKAAQLLLPLLIILAYLLIAAFLLVIVPASLFKNLRPSMSRYSIFMAQFLSVFTWMTAFFFVIQTFGFAAVFVALLFQFLAPVAILGAIFNHSWNYASHLSVWICFIYVMKWFSQKMLNYNSPKEQNSRIIDVDAIEVVEN